MKTMIYTGDCLEELKKIPDSSVDAIVTDPPYGIGFMGKTWDKYDPTVNKGSFKVGTGTHPQGYVAIDRNAFYDFSFKWAVECLRVLKPGGYLLSFGGTRTYHRMASAIEDAGFEIRDMIEWVYGSGFPKSLNVGKSVNQLETNEWSKIGKALDNIDQKSIMDVWKTNAKPAGIQLSKSLTEVGSNTPKKFFVPDIAVLYSNQKNELLNATIAEMRLKGLSLILEEDGIIAVESAGQTIELLPENARLAVKLSESQNLKCWNIFTAQCDVKEWLNENTEVNHKVDEALKILRGNKKYSNEEITNVLCAVLPSVLKLTILNQSKTFQNLDTTQKTECVSAINVIITEYTAENLISNTVDILKSKAVDKLQGNEREDVGESKRHGGGIVGNGSSYELPPTTPNITKGFSDWEGWGTALKPAMELWTLCRKPLSEKTVAENVLKWGTGGINIDGCRVGVGTGETKIVEYPDIKGDNYKQGKQSYKDRDKVIREIKDQGRFPANFIHDGSEEVVSLFPDSKSTGGRIGNKGSALNMMGTRYEAGDPGYGDSGSASRFFYCAKASKGERNMGLDNMEKKAITDAKGNGLGRVCNICGASQLKPCDCKNNTWVLPKKNQNNHPTVKPLALMRYLCRLITPPGGTVLDPYMGSGTTGMACKEEGFNFIGIEIEPEYVKIAEARIKAIPERMF